MTGLLYLRRRVRRWLKRRQEKVYAQYHPTIYSWRKLLQGEK